MRGRDWLFSYLLRRARALALSRPPLVVSFFSRCQRTLLRERALQFELTHTPIPYPNSYPPLFPGYGVTLLDDILGQGFGPGGKHKMGMQSLNAGKAYADKQKMLEALRIQRITGKGRKAPFDFLPGSGLIQECHIHSGSVYHRFSPGQQKAAYMADNTTGGLWQPKGMPNKGFAPPSTRCESGSVGTIKYSVFNLPTMTDVTTRKIKFPRV